MPKASRTVLCLFPESQISGLEDFRQRYILHPGRAVPFHVTLLHEFLLPHELEGDALEKLKTIAQSTPRFDFIAKPLSSFPTTKVLYLTPSPATPIEELSRRLFEAFPQSHHADYGFPVFHMTIALGNRDEDRDAIIQEYFATFGKQSLKLRAGRLGVYAQYGDEWKEYLSVEIGS